MKKTVTTMVGTVLICLAVILAVEFWGVHRVRLDEGTLYGRFTGRNKDLVIVMIPGSGPTDMDGNSPLAQGRNDSLRQLSRLLADQGISSFRYDKRDAGKSGATFSVTTDFNAYVQDLVAVVEYVKKKGYSKVVLLGHSQGSLVGMLAALKVPVDGFISIGGTGLPIDQTLAKQLRAVYGSGSPEMEVLSDLRDGRVSTKVGESHHLFPPLAQEFLLSWMQYDPAQVLAKLQIPTLLIQGELDLQVDMEDFEALVTGRPGETLAVIPGMNHVLKEVTPMQNAPSYFLPLYSPHPELIEVIIQYIRTPGLL